MFLVDFHTHFFSRPFFNGLLNQLPEKKREEGLLENVASKAGLELPSSDDESHARRWLSEMEVHDIDHMVTFASLTEELEPVTGALKISKGKMSGFALVNPMSEGYSKILDRAEATGFKGVLLFPVMHHFEAGDPELKKFWREIARRKFIVIIHYGQLKIKLRELLGLPDIFDFSFSKPDSLADAAKAHPDIPFVVPHFACGYFNEILEVGSSCPNVHVDTSSSNSWLPEDLTLEAVFAKSKEAFGPERILFGTDSCTFPRGWRSDIYSSQSAAMKKAGFSDGEMNQVFGENAKRLLKI